MGPPGRMRLNNPYIAPEAHLCHPIPTLSSRFCYEFLSFQKIGTQITFNKKMRSKLNPESYDLTLFRLASKPL
jgi:hypothetical protein